VSGRVVYRNPWMTVRENNGRHPDGGLGIVGVVEKSDFAPVLPRWRDGFWLVEQFLPAGWVAGVKVPARRWAPGTGGEQVALARRELAEETEVQFVWQQRPVLNKVIKVQKGSAHERSSWRPRSPPRVTHSQDRPIGDW
jgi:hypothetical protein